MILSPEQYATTPVYDLLVAAAMGQVGIDHRFLHAVLDRPEAAAELSRFAAGTREEDRFAVDDDVFRMFRHLRSPEALPFYAEYARSLEFDFPTELTEAFIELGPPSVDTLLSLREEAEDHHDIDFALAALGVKDPRILEALLAELESDPFEGALALGYYGDPAAIPALQAALEKVQPGDPLRDDIEGAIEELERGKTVEPPEPYEIWGEYDEERLPVFEALPPEDLLEFLKSPEPEYRAEAVVYLGCQDRSSELDALLFHVARNDPDVKVRAESWDSLSGSGDPEIGAAMLAVLKDEQAPIEERAGALLGLSERGDPDVREYMVEFCANPQTRAKALQAMWRSKDPAFTEQFPRYLRDPDTDVRRQAILGIAELTVSSAAERLRPLFTDPELREDALYAYAMAAPAEVTLPHMRGLLKRIETIAGGLSREETESVLVALNSRLQACDQPLLHFDDDSGDFDPEPVQPYIAPPKIGRNDPCPCGSGKKYKKCCGG